MKSPIAVDKQTVTKFKITPEVEVSPLQKLAFLQNQKQEIMNMQWRSRVDVIHATRLTESTNEVLKNKGHSNLSTHLNEVEQSTGAIAMLDKLIKELREQYPEISTEE